MKVTQYHLITNYTHIRIVVLISTCIPDFHIVCITGPKHNEQYNTILYNYHRRVKVCSFISSH
jgi:hypothetical protein